LGKVFARGRCGSSNHELSWAPTVGMKGVPSARAEASMDLQRLPKGRPARNRAVGTMRVRVGR
jgi:hypothetical protein